MFNQFIYAIAELDAYVDINSTVSEYNGHKSSDIFLIHIIEVYEC